MPTVYDFESNPGHKLQSLLREIFPFSDDSIPSFLSRIDDALEASGELAEITYNSTINYVVRRLITTAKFLKRRVEAEGLSDVIFAERLKKFIESEVSLPTNKADLIFSLLLDCTKIKRNIPAQKLQRLKKNALQAGKDLRCYFCGVATNLTEDNRYDSATLDHIWPNSLGGSNSDPNLRVICSKCNISKANYIDASDFHYEELCLSSGKEDEHFSTEMHRVYEIAIWTKSDYECTRCGKPALYMGKLQFSRRSFKDSWHFLNIDAYCQEHVRE